MIQTGKTVSSTKKQPKDAIEAMQLVGATPTPHMYEMFYNYFSTRNNELVKALQPYLDGTEEWSDAKGEALYSRHIADDQLSNALDATTAKVGDELKVVMSALSRVGKDAADYEKALAGVGGSLVDETDPESIRKVVDHLVTATATMQNRSQELETKLAETNQEVEQLQLNLEKVKEEAMTDSLTGLCNRKRFDDVLLNARKQAHDTGKPLGLILCDIDHFKRFNDTWGHQTGDQIIRFVATTLQRNMGAGRVAARYGGEEFAIIMPSTDFAKATEIGNTIREIVERKKLVKKSTNENLGNVTISLGLAMLDGSEQVEELIERADKAMYLSKQSGRNQLRTEIDLSNSKAE